MSRNKISAAVYHSHIKGQHSNAQNRQVLQYMREIGQPTTIRMLYKVMNARGYEIDLVSLRRSVTNLSKQDPKGRWLNEWDKQMLKVAFERECPITKITVGWYECTQVQLGLFPRLPLKGEIKEGVAA